MDLSFNKDKYHALHFGSHDLRHVYKLGNYNLIAVDFADDLDLLCVATSLVAMIAIKKSYDTRFC